VFTGTVPSLGYLAIQPGTVLAAPAGLLIYFGVTSRSRCCRRSLREGTGRAVSTIASACRMQSINSRARACSISLAAPIGRRFNIFYTGMPLPLRSRTAISQAALNSCAAVIVALPFTLAMG
jgi:hypothetical protein